MTTEIMTIPARSPEALPLTLSQKIAAIMQEIGKMDKTGEGKGLQYKFIEYSVLAAKVREQFKAQGIVMFSEITECVQHPQPTANGTTTHTLARLTFTLVDTATGESMAYPWYGESNDTGDKGVNKAGTAATKYFLMKLFLISDKDDPDAENGQPIAPTSSPPQADTGAVATLTEKQLAAIYANGLAAGLSKSEIATRSREQFQYPPEQLTPAEASRFIATLHGLPKKVAGAPKPTAQQS